MASVRPSVGRAATVSSSARIVAVCTSALGGDLLSSPEVEAVIRAALAMPAWLIFRYVSAAHARDDGRRVAGLVGNGRSTR